MWYHRVDPIGYRFAWDDHIGFHPTSASARRAAQLRKVRLDGFFIVFPWYVESWLERQVKKREIRKESVKIGPVLAGFVLL